MTAIAADNSLPKQAIVILNKAKQSFDVKRIGEAHHYLGLRIRVGEAVGEIFIDQQAKIEQFLHTHGFYNDLDEITLTPPSQASPFISTVKLTKEQSPQDDDEREALATNKRTRRIEQYRNILGGLIYFSIGTRPDIAHAVSTVAKFAANPGREHLRALEKICDYLKARPEKGILYKKNGETSRDVLHAYSDASWAEETDSRR